MTEVKMPPPMGSFDYRDSSALVTEFAYTEDQLKQYGDDRAREALEMAAVAAWNFHMDRSKRTGISPSVHETWSPVAAIRALKDSIK
jgi:peptide subunit release factor 1 (eRF1)